MPMPAAHAIPNEVKRAQQRGGERGHDCSGSVVASSCVIDAARMPERRRPPGRASSVLASDSSVRRQAGEHGRRPRSPTPPASPGRTASSGTAPRAIAVSAIDDAGEHEAGRRDRRRRACATSPSGRMVGSDCCDVPKARSIAACAMSRTPSEATSFASGDGGAQRPEDDELDRARRSRSRTRGRPRRPAGSTA